MEQDNDIRINCSFLFNTPFHYEEKARNSPLLSPQDKNQLDLNYFKDANNEE